MLYCFDKLGLVEFSATCFFPLLPFKVVRVLLDRLGLIVVCGLAVTCVLPVFSCSFCVHTLMLFLGFGLL